MALSRDQVKGAKRAKDFQPVKVPVPNWAPEGTDPEESFVFVKVLSGHELDAWENSLTEKVGRKVEINRQDFRAKLAVATCCDEEGNPLFTFEDVEWITTLHGADLGRVVTKASEINGMTAEYLEEVAKKSEAPTGSSSSSDSAAT